MTTHGRLLVFTSALHLCLLGAAAATASTITNVGVMTEQGNAFGASSPSGFKSTAFVGAAGPLGSFTHDFSTLGDTEWTVTWRAAPGQFIEIEVPNGSDYFEVEFLFRGGGSQVGGFSKNGFGTDVDLAPGSPALSVVDEQVALTGPGGTSFSSKAYLDDRLLTPGQVYRFTSVTSTVTIPTSYNVSLDQPVSEFMISGEAFFFDPPSVPEDPG